MLSLEQCRKIDPELKNLSDEELLEVRDLLYQMGQLAFDNWAKEKWGSKSPEWLLPTNQGDPNV